MSHPCNDTQLAGGVTQVSYLDDGWTFLRADLVVPWLEAFDRQVAKTGGSRDRKTTKVVYYVSDQDLQSHRDEGRIDALEELATVCKPDTPVLSLGGMLGGKQAVLDLFSEKTKVAKVVHAKVAQVNQTQVEHVLSRFCLSSCKVSHVLRVHGETLADDSVHLKGYDQVQRGTLERMFPGLETMTDTHKLVSAQALEA